MIPWGSQLLYRMILISGLAGLQIATYENVKVPMACSENSPQWLTSPSNSSTLVELQWYIFAWNWPWIELSSILGLYVCVLIKIIILRANLTALLLIRMLNARWIEWRLCHIETTNMFFILWFIFQISHCSLFTCNDNYVIVTCVELCRDRFTKIPMITEQMFILLWNYDLKNH